MVPIGMAMVFAGYTVGIWGYCLVRGYNVTFTQLFATTWPGVTSVASPGHKLGTIPGHTATTNPGNLS